MKHTQLHTLFNMVATFAVATALTSCSLPTQPAPDSTPIGAIEVLPTPMPEATTVDPAPNVPATTLPATALPAATVPAPEEADWVQQSYGEAWTISYPATWTINEAGTHEGALEVTGQYAGHTYRVTYNYPMGILTDSLEAWVEESLLYLPMNAREAVVISDVQVANTPAKKVLNVLSADGTITSHHTYIWRTDTATGGKNPRLITITQTDSQPIDAVAMDQLLDRLLLTVQ